MVKMKNSGIEWIGEIPEDWKVIRNKYVMHKDKSLITKYNNEDILSLTMNGVIKRNLDAGGKMPSSFNGYQKINKGNLLLCLFDIDVTPRCVGIIQNNGITSPAYSQFILTDNNDVRFYYYYYLVTDNKKALVHLSKNLRHSLTEEQFGNLDTIRPPLDQQRAIADFLDKKCADIDKLSVQIKKEIEALQEYRKSVITKAVTKGLDDNVPMKDSGIEWIGKIPETWKLEKIKFLASKMTRGTAPDYTQKHITRVVNQSTFSKGFFDTTNLKYSKKLANDSRGLLQKGDILIASTGGGVLGKVYYFNEIEEYVADSHVTIVRPIPSKLKSRFGYYFYSTLFEVFNGMMSQGSTNQIELQLFDLANSYLPLPNIHIQQKIVNYLDNKTFQIDKIISQKQHQLSLLSDYKNSLIFEYVTGKKQLSSNGGAK